MIINASQICTTGYLYPIYVVFAWININKFIIDESLKRQQFSWNLPILNLKVFVMKQVQLWIIIYLYR